MVFRRKKYKNNYFVLRHGEAISNVKNIISCWPEKFENHLTLKGRRQVKETAKKIKKEKIDIIISSDSLRAKQTAEIVSREIGVPITAYDKRLREYNIGVFNGATIEEFRKYFPPGKERFRKGPPKGENYKDIQKRLNELLKDLEKKYSGKTILLVSHKIVLLLLKSIFEGWTMKEFIEKWCKGESSKIKTASFHKFYLIKK